MRYIINKILASIMMILMAFQVYGETPADSVKVYFRVGHRLFDPALDNNRAVMDSFVNNVRRANVENNISRLVVSGFASPDGANKANERLAMLRCQTIADYISEHTGVERSFIETVPGGVAWGELRSLVSNNPDVPMREKVLEILDNTPLWIFNAEGKIIDGRKAQLMSLSRGVPYRWMLEHLFPELRNAVAVSLFLREDKANRADTPDKDDRENKANREDEADKEDSANRDDREDKADKADGANRANRDENGVVLEEGGNPVVEEISETSNIANFAADSRTCRYFALKSNMLYDAALVPNIGAEFYLGKNISVHANWMYGWWDSDKHHRYWRIYGGELGARWWFGGKAKEKPLTGHHIGIYGGILTFDFEWGDTGYMGGKPGGTLWDRYLVNAGIEYGYSLPIAKRLNIDFSIGLGCLTGKYIKYYPFDNDYYYDKEYKMRFFGPTKAEISLVWLLGHGNTNKRKGGEK